MCKALMSWEEQKSMCLAFFPIVASTLVNIATFFLHQPWGYTHVWSCLHNFSPNLLRKRYCSPSKKTLAKTANCIPQGLRKGSPFKDLLCNSHISFAVKTFHFYKQVKKDAVKIILKKRYKCITHPPLGSQFGHPHWSPRGTFRVAVRQVVLCKAHRIHRMGFYTLHIHLTTVLSWYTDKSW